MALTRVFEPIRIRGLEIPNRVARSAHGTGFSVGPITDHHIAYHVARAKGGVGLTVLEATCVHPSGSPNLTNFDDSVIDGYRRLMAEIRPHGMRVFQQLWHMGHHLPGVINQPPWSASAIPSPLTGLVPIAMSLEQVEEVIAAFASAARRCREGGLDGVEVHAAHGYLIHQFLSPLTNRRTDRYGGPLENRMRFLREILIAVRKAVGPDYPVGVRAGASTATGAIDEGDLAEVLHSLEQEGLIDYLFTSWGDYYQVNKLMATMDEPVGYQIPSSRQITAAVKVPRIVIGRYRTLEEAEQVIREGVADMVALTRAHIADPDIVRKTRDGRADQVRPCIGCNQACLGSVLRGLPLRCVVNPSTGMEATLSDDLIERVSSPKSVLVVGGGPAGMEAARAAALRGHRVKLVEAGPHLGGAVAVAKRAPRLHTLADITFWLEQEIYRLGVDVQLNTYMDKDDVRAAAPDSVIIATGSAPRRNGIQYAVPNAPIPGFELPHVLSSVDLLTGARNDLGKTALVYDDVGHYEAVAAAEFLISKGLAVTFLSRFPTLAHQVEYTTRIDPALRRLREGQFSLLVRYQIQDITEGQCRIRPIWGHRDETVPADTVVLVTANESLRDLYDELRGDYPNAALVGDALAPRDLQAAIAEGHMAGRNIA